MTIDEKLAQIVGIAPESPIIEHLAGVLRRNHGTILWVAGQRFDATETLGYVRRFFLDRRAIQEDGGTPVDFSTLIIPATAVNEHDEEQVKRLREIVRDSESYSLGRETESSFLRLALPWLAASKQGVEAKYLRVGPWKILRPSGDPIFQEVIRAIEVHSGPIPAVPFVLSMALLPDSTREVPPVSG